MSSSGILRPSYHVLLWHSTAELPCPPLAFYRPELPRPGLRLATTSSSGILRSSSGILAELPRPPLAFYGRATTSSSGILRPSYHVLLWHSTAELPRPPTAGYHVLLWHSTAELPRPPLAFYGQATMSSSGILRPSYHVLLWHWHSTAELPCPPLAFYR